MTQLCTCGCHDGELRHSQGGIWAVPCCDEADKPSTQKDTSTNTPHMSTDVSTQKESWMKWFKENCTEGSDSQWWGFIDIDDNQVKELAEKIYDGFIVRAITDHNQALIQRLEKELQELDYDCDPWNQGGVAQLQKAISIIKEQGV